MAEITEKYCRWCGEVSLFVNDECVNCMPGLKPKILYTRNYEQHYNYCEDLELSFTDERDEYKNNPL